MNTTLNFHSGAGKRHPVFHKFAKPGAFDHGLPASAPSGRASLRTVVPALGAVGFLAAIGPLSPAAHAVTCSAMERGTLSGGTFTASATGGDYRVTCTGDTGGKRVTLDDLIAAFAHADADAIGSLSGRTVVALSNAYLDVHTSRFPISGSPEGGIVVLGTEGGAADWNDGVEVTVDDISDDLNIDSHATISTTGGARGVDVWISDVHPYYSRVRVRNHGSITTTGGGSAQQGRLGYGVVAASRSGEVEVVNESGASVVTRGPGGRGIAAGTNSSTATAINRGTITTHGNARLGGSYSYRAATGIYVIGHWDESTHGGGTARAFNESGATVTTHGQGTPGIFAGAGASRNFGVAALATNRGTVTTRGSATSDGYRSMGVIARAQGGTARATNEADATIRTYGTGATGLYAWNTDSWSGRAEAENRGTITTSGGAVGWRLAEGIGAWSEYNTAYAVNHDDGTVTTSGRGARGVVASTRHGGPDESAFALNRGTVTTRGSSHHTDTGTYSNFGVAAFSGSPASAVAENAYTGVIETLGSGATGLTAQAWRAGGTADVRNRGRITTRGNVYPIDRSGTDDDTWRAADGMLAWARESDATVTNESGGVIETHGTVADGMNATTRYGGGTATAVNRGRVTTRGASADNLPGDAGTTFGSRGVRAYSGQGNAHVENDTTGRVDTHGKRAFALAAQTESDGSRTSAMAAAVNRGKAHTRGYNADGVIAIAPSATADNPNQVHAANAAGATITTEGAGSSGLAAGIYVTGTLATSAHGVALARNDGTVVTGDTGDTGDTDTTPTDSMDAGVFASNGVSADFFSRTATITSAGNVTVINTGDVTVKRENATGLYAETFGSGTAMVRMIGGSVSAEGANGHGLWARTGTTGVVNATISAGATIGASGTGGIAAEFDGGTTTVRLLDSVLDGDVEFGTGTDTFTVRDSRVTGAIDFGAGSDTLSVHADTWLEGGFSNLETLAKRGTGNLVVDGDASFSTGANATVENGGLVFTGEFDLGTAGTMTVHNAGRLTAVLVDTSAPPQITAGGGITFHGNEELFVQVAPDISAANETTYLGQLTTASRNPIANGTPVTGLTGQVALRTARGPSTVVDVGHVPLSSGNTNTSGTVVTSGVRLGKFSVDAPADVADVAVAEEDFALPALPRSTGESSLVLGGGPGALGSALFAVFDAENPMFAGNEMHESEVPGMPGFHARRARDGEAEYWTRSWARGTPVLAGGAEATVHAVEVGVDAPMRSGLRLGVSVAPEVSVSSSASGARLGGARWAVRGGWRGKVLHTGASVSQGRYRAHAVMDNPVAGGGLSSAFGLVQEHVQVGAGARLAFNGVRVTPSVSVLSGALRHEAHTAEGATFRAELPAFSQRYRGWKGELGVSPARWLEGPGSLRWRPALHLYTQRTRSASPASLEVSQHDRAGVLSLSSAARVSAMPRTVHGFDATVDALRTQAWRMQLGIAAMESDGEYDQAVYARLHMRF